MAVEIASRPIEQGAVGEFLAAASRAPSALLIDGEPGIGKTTLWSAALEDARERGFRVLSARVATAEPVSAYTSLADLFGGVDPVMWADLPDPQRVAVERVLLRDKTGGTATDQRAVAAAFLSVTDLLTDDGPVLVAIDDLQWLDPSSAYAVAFTARRLSGPVGILGAVRTEPTDAAATDWLQLPRPDALTRIQLRPLSLGGLHVVLSEKLGRTFPRQVLVWIHATSGGNPFYAIELARTLDDHRPGTDPSLPGNLAELVRARIGSLRPEVRDALLAASCLATPTIELVSDATATAPDELVDLLEDAEDKGIIAIEGNRVRFAHPLLATGVYDDASPARRRMIHRRLATILDEPELRARHLALAATSADPETLEALDEAAEAARRRGAPMAAAELLSLAIDLGGDMPERRIALATRYFDAADPARAGRLLEETIADMAPGPLRAEALRWLSLVRLHDYGYREAAALLQRALDEPNVDLAQRVQMLSLSSYALFNIGRPADGLINAEQAVADAERLGRPDVISQALVARVMLHFLGGDGVDDVSLQRALQLEDRTKPTPIALRPHLQNALLLDWTGHLDRSYWELRAIQRRYIDEGDEGELIYVVYHICLNAMWRGDFTEASLVAEDAMERARLLGGEFPLFVALILRAWLATFAGREGDARGAVTEALAASERSGSHRLAEWVVTALGFLETSLQNWDAALAVLQPLLAKHRVAPDSTEMIVASYLPDAVEALVETGRVAEAEPLADALERNGRRLGRAWMLAVGARCRAMVLAAHGDPDAAITAAQRAMVHHDQLPMPFERARTQLLLDQLQRRVRDQSASASLRDALAVFEQLDTPLWAERASAQLTRPETAPDAQGGLTPAERRVAELAASGMTNREVAGVLFISPKTVEATLARVYRKLAIRSRAELGRTMANSVT